MIIEFSVSNYRSILEIETLSMVAAPIRSKNKELDQHNIINAAEKLTLLKSKAIYGANASGKSNVLKAFVTLKRLVRQSVSDETVIEQAGDDFVLSGEPGKNPVFFQLIFLHDNAVYRYGFEVKQRRIISEWLFRKGNSRETYLFTREELKVSVNSVQFSEAKKFENLTETGDSEIFQPHSLFLTATAALGVKLSKALQNAINKIDVVGSTETNTLREISTKWWLDENNRKKGIGLLAAADVDLDAIGISIEEPDYSQFPEEVRMLASKEGPHKVARLTSFHRIRKDGVKENAAIEAYFDSFESEGTQKFSYLVPIILEALTIGNAIWIDEFDARLHPLLTKKIVSLFHSPETNPNGAQLIFITHDTNLLKPSFLRRDQICLVEKDKQGVSHLKTLVEYKGVRNDASYDKDYLQGLYGAVPFLNELDEAFQNVMKEHE